ncbi:MAG: glycosyltransferase [Pseudomonadota bacterium]
MLAEADRRYLDRDWAAALALYEQIRAQHSAAAELALPIGIGHCRIELAGPDQLERLALDGGPCPASARNTMFVIKVRHRALELCSGGDMARASQLLRFLAGFDGAISVTYAYNVAAGRTACSDPPRTLAEEVDPPFLAATGLTDRVVSEVRQREQGRRVLAVMPRYLSRTYEVIDNLVRAAERFGLIVRTFNTHGYVERPDSYAGSLLEAILEFRPDIVYYGDLFENDVASFSPALAEQVSEVLALARSTLGVRVVRYLQDGWRTAARVDGDLYAGLGRCVDVVVHQYPGVLDIGSAAQRAAVFCFPTPCQLPASTVEQGTIPRACFIGRIHEWAYARAVWWAESARLGLPIDWQVQLPWDTARMADPAVSDLEYADQLRRYAVSLSLVSRLNGAKIMPQRAAETLLCGGLLLEESSPETAYFLKPGRHYVTFETLADLAELIPALVADRSRRLALADAGQRWVAKYFTGDYFWAGLLDKLAAHG